MITPDNKPIFTKSQAERSGLLCLAQEKWVAE
jgi:hypothetical protein